MPNFSNLFQGFPQPPSLFTIMANGVPTAYLNTLGLNDITFSSQPLTGLYLVNKQLADNSSSSGHTLYPISPPMVWEAAGLNGFNTSQPTQWWAYAQGKSITANVTNSTFILRSVVAGVPSGQTSYNFSVESNAFVSLQNGQMNYNGNTGVQQVTLNNSSAGVFTAFYWWAMTSANNLGAHTGGNGGALSITFALNNASGNANYNWLNIGGAINQTGSANGLYRGLYINPVLTSMTGTWVSIETSFGLTKLNAGGITGSSTDVLLLTNGTASTSTSTIQQSPNLHFQGSAWATTGATSQSVDFIQYVSPVSGSSASGYLVLASSTGGSTYSNAVTISSSGALTAASTISNPYLFATSTAPSSNSSATYLTPNGIYLPSPGGPSTSLIQATLSGNGGGGIYVITMNTMNNMSWGSGVSGLINISSNFITAATSTAIYNHVAISPNINQPSGANGLSRGIYLNATIPSVFDYRAIESNVGKWVLNQGFMGQTPTKNAAASMTFGSGTFTDISSATGSTISMAASVAYGIVTHASTYSNITYTNAATVYIDGPPATGSNVKITNPYSLYVNNGLTYFNKLSVGSIQDILGSTGINGYILSATANGLQWIPNSGGSGSGSQGSQGNQGYQGLQGSTGSQGNQGYQGLQGSTGSQGNQGYQGLQGSTGSQGNQGLDGSQGNQGYQGLQGSTGSQGNQGLDGIQGIIGSTGSQGNQGFQGIVGYQGPQGPIPSFNLQQVYNNSIGAEIVTGVTQGALSIQRGTNSDTDQVLNIEDGSGNTNFYITGSGSVYEKSLQIWGLSGNGIQSLYIDNFGNVNATSSYGPQGFQGLIGVQGSTGYQGNTGPTINLQQAYNNSIGVEIITSATQGSLTIQRGSSFDTDQVLNIEDGSGNTNFYITGSGSVYEKSLQIWGLSGNGIQSLYVDNFGNVNATNSNISQALALAYSIVL